MTRRIQMHRAVMAELINSDEVGDFVMDLAAPVEAAAKSDPNRGYADAVELRRNYSGGRAGRVSAQVVAPFLGMSVESKRGTLSRALGHAG